MGKINMEPFVKVYIGIDPGLTGAIAMIRSTDKFTPPMIKVWKTPVISGMVDAAEVASILSEFTKGYTPLCCIEKAQAMPKQGVVGVFTYGKGYGQLIACLQIEAIPFYEIPPGTWKKKYSLIKQPKSVSVKVASQLFPSMTKSLYGPRGGLNDGVAEALLLADYCRRIGIGDI